MVSRSSSRCDVVLALRAALTRRTVVASWLLGASALVAASGALAQVDAPAPTETARAFIEKGVAHVLAGCSKPLPPRTCPQGRRVKAWPVQRYQDNHGGPPFTLQTIEYAGMTMTYRAGEVVELIVSSPAWPVRHGLTVGVPLQRVTARLGQPMALQDGEIAAEQVALYCRGEDCVTFTIDRRSARVRKIAWAFYYD